MRIAWSKHVATDCKTPGKSHPRWRSLAQARDLKINVSRAAEEGIARAIRAEQGKLWQIENAEAIADANAFVDKRGLTLAKRRQF